MEEDLIIPKRKRGSRGRGGKKRLDDGPPHVGRPRKYERPEPLPPRERQRAPKTRFVPEPSDRTTRSATGSIAPVTYSRARPDEKRGRPRAAIHPEEVVLNYDDNVEDDENVQEHPSKRRRHDQILDEEQGGDKEHEATVQDAEVLDEGQEMDGQEDDDMADYAPDGPIDGAPKDAGRGGSQCRVSSIDGETMNAASATARRIGGAGMLASQSGDLTRSSSQPRSSAMLAEELPKEQARASNWVTNKETGPAYAAISRRVRWGWEDVKKPTGVLLVSTSRTPDVLSSRVKLSGRRDLSGFSARDASFTMRQTRSQSRHEEYTGP